MTTTMLPTAEALIELHDRLEAAQQALADAVATVAAMIPFREHGKAGIASSSRTAA